MAAPTATGVAILIAADNAPDAAIEDLDRHQPGVLILALNTIAKAQRYYLGIYRLSTRLPLQPHHPPVQQE